MALGARAGMELSFMKPQDRFISTSMTGRMDNYTAKNRLVAERERSFCAPVTKYWYMLGAYKFYGNSVKLHEKYT